MAHTGPHGLAARLNPVTSVTALKVIIIAGPNGAGKTTFAREFLPNEAACPTFVNADLIAAGLAPFAPETVALQAGRFTTTRARRPFCWIGAKNEYNTPH